MKQLGVSTGQGWVGQTPVTGSGMQAASPPKPPGGGGGLDSSNDAAPDRKDVAGLVGASA